MSSYVIFEIESAEKDTYCIKKCIELLGMLDSFSYKREKVSVPISTAKGSQLRIVFSRQTSKEFEPGSSIILKQLVLESDSLWKDTEGIESSGVTLVTAPSDIS